MNSEFRARLFDGEWRLIALTTRRGAGRWEAQLYVDGASIDGNVNFVQCLPFLPTPVSNCSLSRAAAAASGDPRVSRAEGGGAVIIGYGLSAGLDEVRMYSPPLRRKSIIEIGGPIFVSALSISDETLFVAAVASLGTSISATVLFVGRRAGFRIDDANRMNAVEDSETSSSDDDEHPPLPSHRREDIAVGRDALPPESTFNAVECFVEDGEDPIKQLTSSDDDEDEFWREVFDEWGSNNKVTAEQAGHVDKVDLMSGSKGMSLFESDDAKRILGELDMRESKQSRAERKLRSTAVAIGNISVPSSDGLGGGLAALSEGVAIAQHTWQTIAIHMTGFPWPENFQVSLGAAISIASLNFEVSFEVTFALTFYVCAAIGLTAWCCALCLRVGLLHSVGS